MKKIISLLSMAALVVMGEMITSCNKMEEAGSGHRVNPDGSITFTMTLHMGADTKTDINGSTGAHTFKVGDQIAVAYQNTSAVQVKAVSNPLTSDDIKNDSKSARFTVTLTEEPFEYKGNYVYYTYPASMTTANGGIDYSKLNSQDGTLGSLASNLDCCLAYASWNGSDDLPTLTLVNQITIGKFTIKNPSGTAINDDLTSVTITDNTNTRTYVITPAGGASTFSSDPIWVAMQPMSAGTSVTITATDGTNSYEKTTSVPASLGNGKITPINVTMTLVPSIPTGAINGLFSVSSTKQVYFSQGNLQAIGTTSSSPTSGWTWQFAEHQWDYIGGRSNGGSEPQTGNNYINGNGSVSTAGTVDLFGWSTNATYYGIHNSENNGTYSDSFKDWGENAITNGGNRINSGWRTLERTEWAYLWNSRDNAANLRTLATVNNVTGLILMPDGWTASGVALTVTTANYTTNNINSADWNTLEQQGCVFLPAGGYRHGTGIIKAGSYGAYWSSTSTSTSTSSDKATSMDFSSSKVEAYYTNRSTGCSVRLVCNAN